MQSVKQAARLLSKSVFLRQNAVFFFGMLLVSFLNYLYYPVLGRLLPVAEFGEVQAIVSLFLQLIIFMTVLGQVTVNVVANYKDEVKQQKVVFELERLALYFSLTLFLIVLIFGFKIKSFLNFSSVWPFYMLMLSIVATVPFTFRTAYLRGKQRFGSASIANLIGSVVKIAASAIFVLVGFGTVGAIGGLVVAQVLAFAYAARQAHKAGFLRPQGRKYGLPDLRIIAPELRYSLFVLIASLLCTVLSSIDVFVVKHYYDATTAGYYAGISTVARIIFFLTASITQVLLPSVKISVPRRQNRLLLLKSFVLLGAIGGLTSAFFALFPDFVVKILMGSSYLSYAYLLPLLSLAMFMLSVLNLVVGYYMALREYQISVIIILGMCIMSVLMLMHHATLGEVIQNLIYSSGSTLLLMGAWRIAFRNRQTNGVIGKI